MFFVILPRLRVRLSVFALPAAILMISLEGFIPFSILMLSAFLHEAGHLTALKVMRYRYRRIDILPMGALIVCPEGIPDRDELIIALAGPLFSLAAALVTGAVFAASLNVYCLFALCINVFLALFNLLPNAKLDGGKALYCFLALYNKKDAAERICFAASLTATAFISVAAVVCWILSGRNYGVLLLFAAVLIQLI